MRYDPPVQIPHTHTQYGHIVVKESHALSCHILASCFLVRVRDKCTSPFRFNALTHAHTLCELRGGQYLFEDLEAFPTDELKRIVDTNSLGTLLQCRQAIRSMKGNGGHIFLLEGAGADGQGTSKFAAYGATKAGTLQLARSLNEELRGSNVSVHSISPGLVYTELIDAGKSSFGSVGRLAVNTLAETPETVAATLVPKIKEFASKDRNIFFATLLPSRIEFLTIPMAATKFIERLLFGKNKVRVYRELPCIGNQEISIPHNVLNTIKTFFSQLRARVCVCVRVCVRMYVCLQWMHTHRTVSTPNERRQCSRARHPSSSVQLGFRWPEEEALDRVLQIPNAIRRPHLR